MKTIYKGLIVYFIGLIFVFSLIWRFDSLDKQNKIANKKNNCEYVINNKTSCS